MDIKEKLVFARIDEKEFTPEGESSPIKYFVLALGLGGRGDLVEMNIKLSRADYNNLRLADDKPKLDIHSQE